MPQSRRFTISAALAVSLTAFSLMVGCGSGVAPLAPSQNIAAPTASALGPQLGYIWLAADHSLRPILGVAGSSQIGKSVVPPDMYVGAVSSASSSIAILQAIDGSFDRMTLPTGTPAGLTLTLPAGAQMRLSPSGSAALLYTPGAASASLVTGLLTSPVVKTLSAPFPISDSAVSDTGTVSFEYAQGASISIVITGSDGRAMPLASIHAAGGLSFLPGHDDLLFADASANSLTLVRSASSTPETSVIQTNSLLKSPSALAVSSSGHWALVANGATSNSSTQTLVRVDLTSLAGTSVTCSCKPTEVAALADDGAFRLTNVATGPNWIVDAASATPRALFIPALPAPASSTLVASVTVP